ncbi:HelD family protein [Rugosimonospora acidiphila]|uniref:HelD family protein n=1 Tax=Rugosimonospora acidiphila TaxID=556531 RepID=UPI0031E5A11C
MAEEIAAEQRHVDRVYARLTVIKKEAAASETAGYGIARAGNFAALVERDAMVFHAARRRRLLDAEHDGLVFGRLDLQPSANGAADAEITADEFEDRAGDGVAPSATPAGANETGALATGGPATGDPAAGATGTAGEDPGDGNADPGPGNAASGLGEVRYIGRIGLRDTDASPLVIDWRAPAAAPFYRATPVDPLGVVRRRMIQSTGERVTGIEDDLLDPEAAPPGMRVVGDGALVATLARATGTGMRDIVATIQREQDEAIRSPALGVTIVRGGPGTGKTAVALHRVAYLLYADRQRFAGGGVLVVGPSPVFVTYIARVLPSLGEDDVTLRSLGSMVVGTEATRHDPDEVALIKGSLRMSRVLSRAARDASPDTPDELRLLYRGTLLRLDARALRGLRDTVMSGGPKRNAVRAKAAGYVLDALWRQAVELLGAPAVQQRPEFASDTAERREFIGFMRAWWPRLRPVDVLGWLADPERARRYSEGLLSNREIRMLTRSLAGLAADGPSIQDVPLLDELDELLGTPPAPAKRRGDPFMVGGVREVTTHADRVAASRAAALERPDDYREYAHVVVDESQDVSPMQWRMIGRRAEFASWTVVGDPAQSAWHGDPAEARRARNAALGSRRRSEYALTTNYRNSEEIFAVAADVVRRAEPEIELPTAVRRSGVPPRHVLTDDLEPAVREAARDLLAEVDGTVGVIATQATKDLVAGWVAGLDPDRLQTVNSLESKGMEYDGVLVVEPAAIVAESPSGVRTLYVALSRATQRLTTVGTDESWH